MSKRAAAVEATRRKIVEATMALHGEQGVLATSWEDIARRADVAPATVYRHFPTLDELLPACGARVADALELPDDAAVAAAFAGVRGRRGRVRRLVGELFAIYARVVRALVDFDAWRALRARGLDDEGAAAAAATVVDAYLARRPNPR